MATQIIVSCSITEPEAQKYYKQKFSDRKSNFSDWLSNMLIECSRREENPNYLSEEIIIKEAEIELLKKRYTKALEKHNAMNEQKLADMKNNEKENKDALEKSINSSITRLKMWIDKELTEDELMSLANDYISIPKSERKTIFDFLVTKGIKSKLIDRALDKKRQREQATITFTKVPEEDL